MDSPDKIVQIKAALTALLTGAIALLGWRGIIVIVWIAAMFLDFLTGCAAAKMNGQWKSNIAREGLWHKGGSIAVVLVAALLDIAIWAIGQGQIAGVAYDYQALCFPVVTAWYALTELGSNLENAEKMGVKYPEWIKKFIETLKATLKKKD